MLEQLTDSDWSHAFHEAIVGGFGEDGEGVDTATVEAVPPGSSVSTSGFTRDDVVELLGCFDDGQDEPTFECAGRLADGRWFFLSAGCDYTGWD